MTVDVQMSDGAIGGRDQVDPHAVVYKRNLWGIG
jgi:hypothetical protein